jgi:FKBP-type peptidyl-prolyl cis-trans isomerase FkpA
MSETSTESGLKYEDITIGAGDLCTGRGQTAIVHYTGWLEDGSKFDSSKDRNDPFGFPIDCGYVIPGWDEGVVGMQVGGVRKRCGRRHPAQCHTGIRNRAIGNFRIDAPRNAGNPD